MKLAIMCIFDAAAKIYYAPFIAPHPQVGVRAFTDQVNDKTCDQGRHPEDFTLFRIGTYDDATGQIEQLAAHENMGNGVNFVKGN